LAACAVADAIRTVTPSQRTRSQRTRAQELFQAAQALGPHDMDKIGQAGKRKLEKADKRIKASGQDGIGGKTLPSRTQSSRQLQ
jgi:hypothetical protein